MKDDLEKIATFLYKHHVLSLATTDENQLSVCSLFYVYSPQENTFIVASSDDTLHIKNIKHNNKIAGNIVLETKTIEKIQGVQFRGVFEELTDSSLASLYFKKFKYAQIMKPNLWTIKVSYFKMTDNTLGFGKKLIWKDSSL